MIRLLRRSYDALAAVWDGMRSDPWTVVLVVSLVVLAGLAGS